MLSSKTNNRTHSKKQAKEQVCLYSWHYAMIEHNENDDENDN